MSHDLSKPIRIKSLGEIHTTILQRERGVGNAEQAPPKLVISSQPKVAHCSFLLYGAQHPAQNASTQRYGKPAPTDI